MSETLMMSLVEQARKAPKRIALPETGNEMIIKAAREMVDMRIGHPLLIGTKETIEAYAHELNVATDGFEYFDPKTEEDQTALTEAYLAVSDLLSEKGIKRKMKDPVNTAMLLLKAGMADGVAAGREYTTADVIISAQTIVGLLEGFTNISSLGVLNVEGFEGPEGNLLAIADCAVNPLPDADCLADIAIASADTMASLMGWEPRIAMLAFSTCGSTEHESIEPILKAVEKVRERRPDLKIDGEFQLDTAINPAVAAKKVPRDSEVAGKANILVFPNLHAGNIGVKLIQNFAKADAYGPVLQGFAKPICDFSRSAPLSEMMGNITMLVVRAQGK